MRSREVLTRSTLVLAASFALLVACSGSSDGVVDEADGGHLADGATPDTGKLGTSSSSSSSSSTSSTSSSSSSSSSSSGGIVDSGPDVVDSSTGVVDSGPDVADSGPDVVDSGPDPDVCLPAPVPDFTYGAPGRYAGKCTDDEIAALLDACVFNGTINTCEAAKSASATCATCMIGNSNGTVGHPLVVYDDQVAAMASEGACMTAFKMESAATDCGVAFGQVEECALKSCTTSCLDATDDAFTACLQQAIGTTCSQGTAIFASTKCKVAYGDKTYGFCTSQMSAAGEPLNNLQYFTMVSQLVCGSPPANASDAGDGGP